MCQNVSLIANFHMFGKHNTAMALFELVCAHRLGNNLNIMEK